MRPWTRTADRADRRRRLRTAAVAVVAAVRHPLEVPDAFAAVQEATRRHRRAHRCGAYAYGEGSLPATVAAAVGALRIVEVGTALGYTAMAMADAAPLAHVDTVEMDPDHVRLARGQIARHGLGDRVAVRPGTAEEVLPGLGPAPEVTGYLSDPARWRTHSLGESALCVKR